MLRHRLQHLSSLRCTILVVTQYGLKHTPIFVMDFTSSYLSSKQEQRMRLQKYFTSVCSSLVHNPQSTTFGQSIQAWLLCTLTFSHCSKNIASTALIRAEAVHSSSKINTVPCTRSRISPASSCRRYSIRQNILLA